MTARELAVPGAWEITPQVHTDSRGAFFEWFTDAEFTKLPVAFTQFWAEKAVPFEPLIGPRLHVSPKDSPAIATPALP